MDRNETFDSGSTACANASQTNPGYPKPITDNDPTSTAASDGEHDTSQSRWHEQRREDGGNESAQGGKEAGERGAVYSIPFHCQQLLQRIAQLKAHKASGGKA